MSWNSLTKPAYPPFKCPHCGAEEGWYRHFWTKFCQTMDEYGVPFAAEGVDGKGGYRLYCQQCNKNVTRAVTAWEYAVKNKKKEGY